MYQDVKNASIRITDNLNKNGVTAVSVQLSRRDDDDNECLYRVTACYNGYEWQMASAGGYPLNGHNRVESIARGLRRVSFEHCLTDGSRQRPPQVKQSAIAQAIKTLIEGFDLEDAVLQLAQNVCNGAQGMRAALADAQDECARLQAALDEKQAAPDVNALIMQNVVDALTPLICERIRERVGALADAIPTRLEILMGGVKHTTGDAVRHENFSMVLHLVAANQPVWLYGDAGTGKSVLCEQIAEAIGAEYYYCGAILDEFAGLKGFIDANGKKHGTQFTAALDAAAAGREVVLCLDECDGSTPEVLLVLNNLLSGGAVECAGTCYRMSDKLHVIACGNTNGRGGSSAYTRSIIDCATLDRFAHVRIDYSPAIEYSVAGADETLATFARELRESAKRCGIDMLVTYRAIKRLRTMRDFMSMRDALESAVLRGLDAADVKTLYEDMRASCAGNPWHDALA